MNNNADKKRSLIVGLFVFFGLVILIVGILVLGGKQSRFSKSIIINTDFKDVKGLRVGNNVMFSGVKVGVVKDVQFNGVENVKVVLKIEEKSREYIRKDVQATLGTDGLIGSTVIYLVGGSTQVPAIQNEDTILSAQGGGMDAMLNTLQTNNENLLEITKNFAVVSSQMAHGKGAIGSLLTDESISKSLKQSLINLEKAMKGVDKSVDNMVEISGKLNADHGLIHDLTSDSTIFESLRKTAAELQGVSQTASAIMINLDEVTSRLNDKDNLVGVMLNDKNSADKIRSIIENLDQSSAKLYENMKAIRSNFLFRKYFKNLDKEGKDRLKDSLNQTN